MSFAEAAREGFESPHADTESTTTAHGTAQEARRRPSRVRPSTERREAASSGELNTALDDVLHSGKDVRDAVMMLGASAKEMFHAASVFTAAQAREHPYGTLGVAAGVGFVVAGGLSSPIGKGLIGLGSRLAFAEITRRVTMAVSGEDLDASTSET